MTTDNRCACDRCLARIALRVVGTLVLYTSSVLAWLLVATLS